MHRFLSIAILSLLLIVPVIAQDKPNILVIWGDDIGWSNIQWLAAALTFGLAFGLQEIFGNFISGLILLAFGAILFWVTGRRRVLAQANQRLETRVSERTAELSAAN